MVLYRHKENTVLSLTKLDYPVNVHYDFNILCKKPISFIQPHVTGRLKKTHLGINESFLWNASTIDEMYVLIWKYPLLALKTTEILKSL